MAGHSKWANIKFRKSVQDAKRGKIFTKLIREISVAARMGGPDEASNSRLRDVVSKALKANMKRDTIDNAIKRGAGGLDGANMTEMRYEGYGHGGNLGTDGSVAYMFNKQGEIIIASSDKKDELIDQLIEIGVEDIIEVDEHLLCITAPDEYHQVLKSLEDLKIEVEQSQLAMRAQNLIQVSGDAAESLEKLIDSLEDLDDVQEVYFNAEFPE
jgi:transcriptional/translational regulatory protein YebC/TACO1